MKDELNTYMINYFKESKKKKNLLLLAKTCTINMIKMTIGFLSIWFPFIGKRLLNTDTASCQNLMSTTVVNKSFEPLTIDISRKEHILTNVFIAPENITTGFFEDFQLII